MKIITQESQAEQARRLAAKTQDQRMVNEVVSGTGMSPWEAQVVVEVIREVYFATPGGAPLRHGQMLYTCVKVEAGAGVALKDCPMQSVTLSLLGEGDDQVHGAEMLRRRRIGRLCEEARDQGGLLTQEDLAQILSCDARTIRRDIKALKQTGIHIPTRGQQPNGVRQTARSAARRASGKGGGSESKGHRPYLDAQRRGHPPLAGGQGAAGSRARHRSPAACRGALLEPLRSRHLLHTTRVQHVAMGEKTLRAAFDKE